MNIDNISKINGKFVENKEINIVQLKNELKMLQDRKSMLTNVLQKHIIEVNTEIDQLDIKIEKINTLLK